MSAGEMNWHNFGQMIMIERFMIEPGLTIVRINNRNAISESKKQYACDKN